MPEVQLTKRQRLEKLKGHLWTTRASFDTSWRDIASFLFPTRPRWTVSDRNKGDRRNQAIIDNTATYAMNTLRSGLHAGLTSPARPWMKLTTPDPGLARKPNVASWLQEVTDRMHAIFHMSNIYNALPMGYGDIGVFGTGALGIIDDPGTHGYDGDLIRAQVYPIGSFAVGRDSRGMATTFVRETGKTVESVIQEFGGKDGEPLRHGQEMDRSRFSRQTLRAWDKGDYHDPVTVNWAVYPNQEWDRNKLGWRNFPFSSCHWEQGSDTGTFLRESGFREFPVLAPRWTSTPDEDYANDCPGMTALGDVKQLQGQQRLKGRAIEKMVNPALVGPLSLQSQKVSLLPGGITYTDVREGMQGLKPVHEVDPKLDAFVMDINEVQRRIDRAFYVDLFLMLSYQPRGAQPPTAREVQERHEEKMLVLGPVLESLIDELLDPMVDRVFAMMLRAGLIPDAPPELDGVTLTVEYTSILAQALKMQQVGVLDRFVGTMLPLGDRFPEIMAAMDPRFIARTYQDALGVHPDVLRKDEEIDAAMAAQAQQQQEAVAAQNAQAAAKAAKDLGTTPMGTGSALDRLAGVA
jgi:hypothetical protein